MLLNNINFWRIATALLFVAVLVLLFPWLDFGPDFTLESSSMEIVNEPLYGARFIFEVNNDGDAGDAHVTCYLYLFERGGDTESDYVVVGVEENTTESGELFIPLPDGQQVHDWRVEVD
jgi:hypothetical protein